MKFKILLFLLLTFPFISLFSQNKGDALGLYREGLYKEAIEQTMKEIRINPKNMDARTIQTWSLIALKKYEETEKIATESLEINPLDVRIIEILGEAYFYQNKLDPALKEFSKYVELAPTGARIGKVYSFMGDAFFKQKKFFESELAYTAATKDIPNSFSLWLKVGEARLAIKNDEGAKVAFEKVLEIYPNNTQALQYLKNI